jgi:hypothetical protein
MNERARRAGLSVDIASRVDGETGTVVTLIVPTCVPVAGTVPAMVTA